MAADLVGYSRLMGEDETGTLVALQELRASLIDPTIAQYKGRIVKLMGDGTLVEFASVVDAVECAVGIQSGIAKRNTDTPDSKRIAFRIGINLGDVIIDGDDIYGDGVNVAARLEGLAEPGGICVSEKVFAEVRAKLETGFEDLGPQRVKNIADHVRAYRVTVDRTPAVSNTPATTLPDKPSIAVLPFDNMSGDPEQEYFSDGMAEDLITDISKISGVFVTARNSSFAFKGQTIDVKEIAEKLGVKHILEGSVRKMGSKLRINAQLIDAASGGHIWAERYDGNMENIFEFQDDIREQIVAALQVSLTSADEALTERKTTESVEAYDLLLKGRANIHFYTPERMLDAINCFHAAIEIDPNFADAYGYLSYCYFYGRIVMWPEFGENFDRAEEAAQTGVALDNTSAIAVTNLGLVQTWLRQYDQAVANLGKAVALDPNNSQVFATFGQALNYIGDPGKGLELLQKALRFETNPPAVWEFQLGHAHLLLGQFDEAIAKFLQTIERAPNVTPPNLFSACTYVELNRLDDAKEMIKSALNITPQYTLKLFASVYPYKLDEVHKRLLDALRKAGLPEE